MRLNKDHLSDTANTEVEKIMPTLGKKTKDLFIAELKTLFDEKSKKYYTEYVDLAKLSRDEVLNIAKKHRLI
jgi:hypothetical protein